MTDGYILGIDYGNKRIGLALAHSVAKLPHPYSTITQDEHAVNAIKQICDDEKVQQLVVGLPRNMDGSLGAQADVCEKFGKQLAAAISLPVYFAEEALSSVAAHNTAAADIDATAAATILERYFNEGAVEL